MHTGSGCLSHEKEHPMRELDFGEIHSRINLLISENKSRPHTLRTASQLKVYEKQTKQNHGRSPSIS